MRILFLKSLVSVVFLLVTLISLWSMLEILGKEKKCFGVLTLRHVHRIAGISFLMLFSGLSLVGILFIVPDSGELSFRAFIHFLLAVAVFLIFSVKLAIVRRYKQLFKYVQGMGLSLFFLSVLLFATSGGYYLMVYKLSLTSPPTLEVNVTANEIDGDLARKGARLFSDNCVYCHEILSTEIKLGPGMKGILKNPTLPSSNKPATPANIIDQLTNPYKMMPSFKDKLSQDQMKAIIEYLKTL
jgi:mono/diheme cytochrome c family protein